MATPGYFEGRGIPVWIRSLFDHFPYLKRLGGQSSLVRQNLAL